MGNTITEQLTAAGQRIEHDSFAIVDQEAGAHGYTPPQWQVVRRLIHATADFDFNGLTHFHPAAIEAGLAAIAAAAPILADVAMVSVGLSQPRLRHFDMAVHDFIAQPEVIARAQGENTTRAVQAVRYAHQRGLLDGAIVAIGNAPTALLEVVRLIETGAARPALIIGMPVGFVAAAESKQAVSHCPVPWIITVGRKGGSPLVVATIHALLALAEAAAPQGAHGRN